MTRKRGDVKMPITREINGKMITVEDSARQLCEIFCRVVGYYRPISEYNIGQKQMFYDRLNYDIDKTIGNIKI